MFVFVFAELLLWMIFPVFSRYCLSVKRVGRNVPFKLGPFMVFLLVNLGGLLNLFCLVMFYHAQHAVLEFRIIMFLLAAGFIVRMCLGLTVSIFDQAGRR